MTALSKSNTPTEPTRSELEILQVLWEHGPSTVRFVNDTLNEQKREVQYTATLKLMQIMLDKGLLHRDDSQMKHVYSAAVEESKNKKHVAGPIRANHVQRFCQFADDAVAGK